MERQTPPNYYKRRIAVLFFFATFFLFLGRQLTFLPTINLSENSKEEDLKTTIEKVINGKPGFYSIYYHDLNSDKSFGISEKQIETGASINKLPIVAALYYLNSKGKIDLDEKITIQKSDVQDYGTGTIRYQTMPQTYSLRNLAKLSLQVSDNTAAHVISVRIGEDVIQNLVKSWGMSSTLMADNKTTSYDMYLLYKKIYSNETTDTHRTSELLSFMTDTDFEDRITKGLHANAKSFHKTGDGDGFVHDVGIIETGKGKSYYLGVMTSDIGDNLDITKNTMAEISKKIYNKINGD